MNINTQKKLKSLTNLYEFILIEGNHDKNIMYEIPSHKILRLNDIEFIHEAIVDDRHQISGHYHPTLSVKLNGKRVTEKCILETESKLILPSFGKYTGKFDILRSLASLSYDGRRTTFFQKELKNSLKIIDNGHFPKKDFYGSWAGAFGQTQFMPSTFIKYAVDFDGDNRKNLFKKSDALASGANYLNKTGWTNGTTWGERFNIEITKKMKSLSKKKQFKKIDFWKKIGFTIKKKYNKNQLLRLVIPDSNFNECYLVSKNFDVILGWNRSNYFALTVFLFADEIKQ